MQFHVITPTKAFCKRIVLNLQLGYLKQQKHLISNILCNKKPFVALGCAISLQDLQTCSQFKKSQGAQIKTCISICFGPQQELFKSNFVENMTVLQHAFGELSFQLFLGASNYSQITRENEVINHISRNLTRFRGSKAKQFNERMSQ